jgi:hypothetical protein
VWDNRAGRNHTLNILEANIENSKKKLGAKIEDSNGKSKEDIGRIDQKLDYLDGKWIICSKQ